MQCSSSQQSVMKDFFSPSGNFLGWPGSPAYASFCELIKSMEHLGIPVFPPLPLYQNNWHLMYESWGQVSACLATSCKLSGKIGCTVALGRGAVRRVLHRCIPGKDTSLLPADPHPHLILQRGSRQGLWSPFLIERTKKKERRKGCENVFH